MRCTLNRYFLRCFLLFALLAQVSCGGGGGGGSESADADGGPIAPPADNQTPDINPPADDNQPEGELTPVSDFFGPPPADDVSAYTDGIALTVLPSLPHANDGAYEGPGGIFVDPGANNSVPADQQQSSNIPTNSKPSPLFSAQAFTQKMLLFEEFGTEPMTSPAAPAPALSFPAPTTGPAPRAGSV